MTLGKGGLGWESHGKTGSKCWSARPRVGYIFRFQAVLSSRRAGRSAGVYAL